MCIRDSANLAYNDFTIQMWNTRTGEHLRTLNSHRAESVVFSPDGSTLVSGGEKGIHIRDAGTGKLLNTIGEYTGEVRSIVFLPDGETLAAASADETLRLWTVLGGANRSTFDTHTFPKGLPRENNVYSRAFSSDGATYATASTDKMIRLWETQTGLVLRTMENESIYTYALAFSSDGLTLASAGNWNNGIRIWDVKSGELLYSLGGNINWIYRLCFSPDNSILASSNGNDIRLWDVRTREILHNSGGIQEQSSQWRSFPTARHLLAGAPIVAFAYGTFKPVNLLNRLSGLPGR